MYLQTKMQSPEINGDEVHKYHSKETLNEPKTVSALSNLRYVILFLFNAGYVSTFSISYQYIFSVEKQKQTMTSPSSNTSATNGTYCGMSVNFTEENCQGQIDQETSTWLLNLSLASGIPAIFMTILFGALSDYIGRKFMFFFASFGVLLKTVIFTLIVKLNLDLSYAYIGYIIEGFSGSGFVILLASFSYTADVTKSGHKRVFGIVLMEFVNTISNGGISLAIGHIIDAYGLFVPMLICCGCLVLSTITIVFLPETVQKQELSWSHLINGVQNMVKLYTVETVTKRRTTLIISIAAFFLILQSLLGSSGISVIYRMSEPFCFTASDLGYYSALSSVAAQLVGVALIKLQQKILTGPQIAIIGSTFDMAGNILNGLAGNKITIFMCKYCI